MDSFKEMAFALGVFASHLLAFSFPALALTEGSCLCAVRRQGERGRLEGCPFGRNPESLFRFEEF